jgi:hypothetical protein
MNFAEAFAIVGSLLAVGATIGFIAWAALKYGFRDKP